jgi:hypothetical protein
MGTANLRWFKISEYVSLEKQHCFPVVPYDIRREREERVCAREGFERQVLARCFSAKAF